MRPALLLTVFCVAFLASCESVRTKKERDILAGAVVSRAAEAESKGDIQRFKKYDMEKVSRFGRDEFRQSSTEYKGSRYRTSEFNTGGGHRFQGSEARTGSYGQADKTSRWAGLFRRKKEESYQLPSPYGVDTNRWSGLVNRNSERGFEAREGTVSKFPGVISEYKTAQQRASTPTVTKNRSGGGFIRGLLGGG